MTSESGHDGNGDQPVRPGDEGEPELDVDTAFAAIVAGWASDPGPEVSAWPAAEDVDRDPGPAARPTPPATSATPVDEARATAPDGEDDGPGEILLPPAVRGDTVLTGATIGPRDVHGDTAEREEGFVPPEPPPLPRGDLVTRLLWLGAIGGPLFLVIAAIAWRDAPQVLILGAVAAFAAGFVTLVVRMPRERGPDDDDDGAVV